MCALSLNTRWAAQGVVAKIQPDTWRGKVGQLDLLGAEPVAIAVIADQQPAAAS
jgi:hypothetical protein